MAYKVLFTDKAKQDLNEINTYHLFEQNSTTFIEKFTKRLFKIFGVLEDFPYAYPRIKNDFLNNLDFRVAKAIKYNIIFKISDENKTVVIYRIVSIKMDLENPKVEIC